MIFNQLLTMGLTADFCVAGVYLEWERKNIRNFFWRWLINIPNDPIPFSLRPKSDI